MSCPYLNHLAKDKLSFSSHFVLFLCNRCRRIDYGTATSWFCSIASSFLMDQTAVVLCGLWFCWQRALTLHLGQRECSECRCCEWHIRDVFVDRAINKHSQRWEFCVWESVSVRKDTFVYTLYIYFSCFPVISANNLLIKLIAMD